MINTSTKIIVGIVIFVLITFLCMIVLPKFLPATGELDFLVDIIPLATGIGLCIGIVLYMFRNGNHFD